MNALPPPPVVDRRTIWLVAGGLALATLVAYHNSLAGPFVFDDLPGISENPSIRRLWPLGPVLLPELDGGLTVSGRPLVNFSLALNHALGAEAVLGYHLFNLGVHVLAGLVLFGAMRRTFLQPRLASRFGASALPLGLTVAALWLMHPLQTEAVTYLVQRAEALMALCCLLTLYAFIRGAASARQGGWLVLSFIACLLGMASKEVMVVAPLLVLLYDRTFVAGTFREAWRRRSLYYIGLAGTWLLLAWLVAGTTGRGGTAGFGTAVGPWPYLLTQCRAIVHYLRLVVWPDPLVFDYGMATVGGLSEVWLQGLLLVALAAGTLVALVWRPVWGFAGACFFLILAPSSSFVPVASQTMAEHRMYLPLAIILALAVTGLHGWLGRRSWLLWGALAVAWGGLTIRRNADYASDLGLWADTVAKCPTNGRAHNNLGKALLAANRVPEARAEFEEASRLQPAVPEPHYNLGLALGRLNQPAEAIRHYEEALRLQPAYAEAHNNLGSVLLASGPPAGPAAGRHYEEAVRLKPEFADAHSNLAKFRLEQGRVDDAIKHGAEAVRLEPRHAEAHFNLGNALQQAGRLPEALAHYQEALRLKPDYGDVANNLGNVLAELGRLSEAIPAYERALTLDPGYPDARRNLAKVLIHLNRLPEAVALYQKLARARPDDGAIRAELAELQSLVR